MYVLLVIVGENHLVGKFLYLFVFICGRFPVHFMDIKSMHILSYFLSCVLSAIYSSTFNFYPCMYLYLKQLC